MIRPYVAIEGTEGAGKSTFAAALAVRLDDGRRPVLAVREPGGTPAGERIRALLLGGTTELAPWTEALLFAAARAQLVKDVVNPALEAGSIVLTDRSVYSSLAYQGAGRGLGVEEVRAINERGLEGVWPEVVVLLKVDPTTGMSRQRVADRIGAEGIAFQSAVAGAFEALAKAEPARFIVVEADRQVDSLVDDVYEELVQRW